MGGGVFGLTTALEAAQRGWPTTVLERATIPNPVAASSGASRSIRSTYAEPHYARLAREALVAWRNIERGVGRDLVDRSGNLYYTNRADQPELDARIAGARDGGSEVLVLDEATLRARAPYLRHARRGMVEPDAAFVRATDAMDALCHLAREAGVDIRVRTEVVAIDAAGDGLRVATAAGERVESDVVVLAGGGWSPRLLPTLRPQLTQRRAGFVRLFGLSAMFDHPAADQFMNLDSWWYGFPALPGYGMKVGRHLPGPLTDDPDFDREAEPEGFFEAVRPFLRDDLGIDLDATEHVLDVCMYNVTPTADFLLDWVPDVPGLFVATGGSGHGFKFGPMLGRIVVDRIAGHSDDRWNEAFSWGAFQSAVATGRSL